MQIPKWFDDPDAPWPCPCGDPPYGTMMLAEDEEGGRYLLHERCMMIMMNLGESDG
jgi:hypothetical protein